jgi:hypothetical protein
VRGLLGVIKVMPYTEEQKINIVLNAGLDPNKYLFDEVRSGFVPRLSFGVPAQQVSPQPIVTPTPTPTPTPNKLGRGQAAWAVGKRAIAPTLIGGLGATAAAAPFTGPGAILAGAGGALVSSALGSVGQEKLLEAVQSPEDYLKGKQLVEQARKEYPVQSFFTEAVPSLLLGGPTKSIFTGARNLLKGSKFSALAPAEQQALKLGAAQAGIGAGTDVVSQNFLEGEDHTYNPLRTLGAAGLGGILSKPQLLGKTRAFGGYKPLVQADQTQPTAKIAPPVEPSVKDPAFTPKELRSSGGVELGIKEGMDLPTSLRPDIQQQVKETTARLKNQREAFEPAVEVPNQAIFEVEGFKLKPRSSLNKRLATSQQKVVGRYGLPDIEPTGLTQEPTAKRVTQQEVPIIGASKPLKSSVDVASEKTGTPNFIFKDQVQPTSKIFTPSFGTKRIIPSARAIETKAGVPIKIYNPATGQLVSEPTIGQQPVVEVPKQIEIQTGWTFKPTGAINTESLPPELAAKIPKQWEFTDRRAGSPTEGFTIYVPEGATPEIIQTAITKKAQEATTVTKITTFLDGLKIGQGKGDLHAFGLPAHLWNDGIIEPLKLLVKAGAKVGDAIEQVIAKIKAAGHKFDEAGARTFLQSSKISELQPEGVTPPPITAPAKVATSDKEFSIPGVRSGIDAIKNVGTLGAQKTAEAFTKFYERFRALKGEYLTDINNKLLGKITPLTPKDWIFQDNESNKKVLLALYKESDFNKTAPEVSSFTPEEQEVYKTLRQLLVKSANDQIARGIPVEGAEGKRRQRGIDPFYMPHVMDSEVINTILNSPASPESLRYKKDFVDYRTKVKGQKLEEALTEWDDLIAAFGGTQSNIASQFGPVDKAEGKGLPLSMRETNLVKAVDKYFKRVSRRFAYYDTIESDPAVRTALGIKTDVTGAPTLKVEGVDNVSGNENVKAVLNDITGNRSRKELKREAVSGVVRSLMLGFQTGAVDFTTNLSAGLHYFTPTQVVKSLGSAFKNYESNLKASFQTGVNTHNIGTIEASVSGLNEVVSAANRFRDAINTLQLRNAFEKATRAVAFGKGKFVVLDNVNYFAGGGKPNSQRERFLDTYGPSDWRTKISKGLTEAEVNEAAAKYVEDVQGTYDYRQLPAIAVEGSLAPFLSLSRWNIAQANRFTRNVLNPALKGDFKPFLMSTLSPLIGGYAVKELRELLSGGRKSRTPELKEVLASKPSVTNPETYKALFYKMATLADYSGYAGLLGNTLKIASDTVYKNPTQAFSNPFVDFLTDTFNLAQDAIQAFNDGEFELGLDNISRVIENYAQTYRILANNLIESRGQEIERANENRDLRVFRQLQGKSVSDISNYGKENLFANKDVKRFKQSDDLKESSELLYQKILPRYVNELNETKDMGAFQQRLRSLKGIPTISFPSPESNPQEFAEFYNYLQNTQGADQAKNRSSLYFRRRALNRAKSSMVP